MNDVIITLDDEKTRLTERSSELYSTNVINIEEYERLIEYINKIETKKEISVIDGIIRGYQSNSVYEAPVGQDRTIHENRPVYEEGSVYKSNRADERAAVFSQRTTHLTRADGRAGKFSTVFGVNKIIVEDLLPGRTELNLETVFGSTEIVVPRGIRITNKADVVFSGTFIADELHSDSRELPELYITGSVVFGNLSVIRK